MAVSFFDQITETAKKLGNDISDSAQKVGDEISEGAHKVGEEVGLVDKKSADVAPAQEKGADQTTTTVNSAAADPLPAGVTSRFKKMTSELDKTDQALAANSGKPSDRINLHLQKARGLQAEIRKSYTGQFPASHPEVAAAYGRLDQHEVKLQAADSGAARAQEAAPIPSGPPPSGSTCSDWDKKFQEFTQGGKALHVYTAADTGLMSQWKSNHDEAVAQLEQYRSTSFNADKCPQTEGTINLLTLKWRISRRCMATTSRRSPKTA